MGDTESLESLGRERVDSLTLLLQIIGRASLIKCLDLAHSENAQQGLHRNFAVGYVSADTNPS